MLGTDKLVDCLEFNNCDTLSGFHELPTSMDTSDLVDCLVCYISETWT